MAKPYRRGKTWYAKLYWPTHPDAGKDGRVRVPLSKDFHEANSLLANLVIQRAAEKTSGPAGSTSWPVFRQRYEESIRESAHFTRDHHRNALNRLESFFKDKMSNPLKDVRQVTPGILDAFYATMPKAGKGQYGSAKIVKSTKAVMRKAELWGILPIQDWKAVKVKKLPKGRVDFYTIEELRKIVAAMPGYWKTAVYLGVRFGLRPAEIYHAEKAGVDFEAGRINVYGMKCEECSERFHKPGWWEPKDKEPRSIPMKRDIRAYLKDLLPKLDGKKLIQDANGERPTFGSFMTLYRNRLAAMKMRGTLYLLRHTFAAQLIQAGVSLERIREYLGHDDINMTLIYSHLAPAAFDTDIERMADI